MNVPNYPAYEQHDFLMGYTPLESLLSGLEHTAIPSPYLWVLSNGVYFL